MEFLTENWGYVVAVLLAVSELVAQVPSIKANSIFQLIVGLLKSTKK